MLKSLVAPQTTGIELMNFRRRWKQSSFTNQANVLLTALICIMTAINVGFFVKQALDSEKQVQAITGSITTGAKTTKEAIDSSLQENRAALETVLSENRETLKRSLESIHNDAQRGLNASIAQGRKALDASIEANRNDQRAWVGVTDAIPPAFNDAGKQVFLKVGERATVGVYVTNTGKSPALDLSFRYRTRILRPDQKVMPNYGKEVQGVAVSSREAGLSCQSQFHLLKARPSQEPILTLSKRRKSLFICSEKFCTEMLSMDRTKPLSVCI